MIFTLRYNNQYIYPYVLATAVLWISYAFSVNTDSKALALIGCILTILPIVRYFSKARFDRFPFLESIMLFYFFENFFCYFFQNQFKFFNVTFQPFSALSLSISGIILFRLGFSLLKRNKIRYTLRVANPGIQDLKVYNFFLALLIIGQILPSILQSLFLSQLIVPSSYFIIPYFLLLIKNRTLKIQSRPFLFTGVYFALLLINILVSGFLAPLMVLGCFSAFCTLVLVKKISKKYVILAIPIVLLFALMSQEKTEYRELVADNDNLTKVEKIVIYRNLVLSTFSTKSNRYEKNEYQLGTLERLGNGFIYLSAVVEQTPRKVKYFGGDTYAELLYKFIPRFLWPNKPNEDLGNSIAHKFNLLRRDDTTTSFNFPILAEFYANFGFLGIVFGMLLLGMICGYIDNSFNIRKTDLDTHHFYKVSAGLSILGLVIFQESNFTLIFGNIILFAIIYKIIGGWLIKPS